MVKQSVRVVIRTRPTADFASKNIKIDSAQGTINLSCEKDPEDGHVNNKTDSWKFSFEKLLHNASQDETYEATASEIVQSATEGFNGTVFCYGQTGAGKTYTMTGSSTIFKYRGILPRAVNQLYAITSAKFDQAITIRVSYAEIYNEHIRDLLPSAKASSDMMQQDQNLQITDDSRGGVLVKGLNQHVCESEEDALNCLFEGEMNRTFRQHYLNATSSRAHCIFTMYIESRSRVESSDKVMHSKLHLVDLAGSERTKKTHSEGEVLKEASFINKSLTFLEQVVLALCDRKRDHVPYRSSKLTNMLRDSLGGNCKTVMICNVWPEARHIEETTSSLKFATRMMKIQNEASVNIIADPNLLIKRYENEIKSLKQELAMHDTLANRGRINYATYNQEEQAAMQRITTEFLSGEREDIGEIDSLRKVREIFSQIRLQYRRNQQNIEAIKRQLEANPGAFKELQKQDVRASQSFEDRVSSKSVVEVTKSEVEQSEKREPIDKQEAFIEFKRTEGGQQLDEKVHGLRKVTKDNRTNIKGVTEELNKTKHMIDQLKQKIDRKENERKLRFHNEQLKADDDFAEAPEEIIDEEELVMLRQMKDLKKSYRDLFSDLKQFKDDHDQAQQQIDVVKEQLLSKFEAWYSASFKSDGMMSSLMVEEQAKEEYFQEPNSHDAFDEQTVFKRAKKTVDVLHKAKKNERMAAGRDPKDKEKQTKPDEQNQCRPQYGLSELTNQVIENVFCFEHSGRTCCDAKDTTKLRSHFEVVKKELSPMCLDLLTQATCSYCDPDFGTGVTRGFCHSYCSTLWETCKETFLDPYLNPREGIPICKEDVSLICAPASTYIQTSDQFCKALGFEIDQTDNCFRGQGKVGTSKYPKLPRKQKKQTVEETDDWLQYYVLNAQQALVNFYWNKIHGVVLFLLTCVGLALLYDCFITRKYHKQCWTKICGKSQTRKGMSNKELQRREKLEYMREQRLK